MANSVNKAFLIGRVGKDPDTKTFQADLTQGRLQELLIYDPETGIFRWKHRPQSRPSWNARFAGKIAGTLNLIGYVQIGIDLKLYFGHRLAWLYVHEAWPSLGIDHIDGDGSNNKIANLRVATKSENQQNRPRISKNSSGTLGVSWDKPRKKWAVSAFLDGKQHHLGRFTSKEEANAASHNWRITNFVGYTGRDT